ncbi:hypothetical protein Tco_0809759 [Tanacetum coccineum]
MHNNIMAAGSRDRPPMLAPGIYSQWQSRFLRYIDTRPNGDALRKCLLEGPYQLTTVIILVVPATENSPEVPEQTAVETLLNIGLVKFGGELLVRGGLHRIVASWLENNSRRVGKSELLQNHGGLPSKILSTSWPVRQRFAQTIGDGLVDFKAAV